MKKLFFFQLAFVMLAFHQPVYAGDTIRVACIGNSITASLYPGYLATKMNSQGYNVQNFGYSGTTGTRGVSMGSSFLSWVNTSKFDAAKAFKPQIVTIALGTNDSRPEIWNNPTYANKYGIDIQFLIDAFRAIDPNVKIYLMYPCPINPNSRYNNQPYYIPEKVMPEIKKLADANGLKTINFYAALAGHVEDFKTGDLLHPNEAGHAILADAVFNVITGTGVILRGAVEYFIKQSDIFFKNAVNGTNVGEYDLTKYNDLQSVLTESKNTYKSLLTQTEVDDLANRLFTSMIAYQRSIKLANALPNGNYKIRLAGNCLSSLKGAGASATYEQESNDSTQIWAVNKNTSTGGYNLYNAYKKLYMNDYGVLSTSVDANLTAVLIMGNGKRYSIQQNPLAGSGSAFWTSNARTSAFFTSMGYPDYFTFDFIDTKIPLPAFIPEATVSNPIRVACVGNSITDGIDRYPTTLATMLGKGYTVGNFGKSGSTINMASNNAYTKTTEYQAALAFLPNVVTIKLGTNDSNPAFWVSKLSFEGDLRLLIKNFKSLASNPIVYLCIPVGAIANTYGIRDSYLRDSIAPIIYKVAVDLNLKVIDTYTYLQEYPLFNVSDGVHPNAEGSNALAEAIYKGITTADYNYKKAPAYFTPIGGQNYQITNKATGQSLTINGMNSVIDTAYVNPKTQLFIFEQQSYGRYRIKNSSIGTYMYAIGDSIKFGSPGTNAYNYLHLFVSTGKADEYLMGTNYGAFYKAGVKAKTINCKGNDAAYNDSSVWIITKNLFIPRIELPGTFTASQLSAKVNTPDNRMTTSGSIIGNITSGNQCYYLVTVTKGGALDATMSATTNKATTVVMLTLQNESNATVVYSITQSLAVTNGWSDWNDNLFRFANVPGGNYKLYVKIISTSGSWACNIAGFNFQTKAPGIPGTIYAGNFDYKSHIDFIKVESDQSLDMARQGQQVCFYVEPTEVGNYTANVEYANMSDPNAKMNLQFVSAFTDTSEDANFTKSLLTTGGSNLVKNWTILSYNFIVPTIGRKILRLRFPNTGGTWGAFVRALQFTKKITGINDTENFNNLIVSSRDNKLNIHCDDTILSVRVINVAGITVLDDIVNSKEYIKPLQKGIYIIQIKTPSQIKFKKVLIN